MPGVGDQSGTSGGVLTPSGDRTEREPRIPSLSPLPFLFPLPLPLLLLVLPLPGSRLLSPLKKGWELHFSTVLLPVISVRLI